jgi:hypothetical protein
MTIKDLKAKLSSIDDSYTVTVQKKDGTQKDITKAETQGDHFTFWIDSADK